MKKQTLIILSLIVIISGILSTTVYAEGGGELPPIQIPDENISVNTTSGDTLPTASTEYEVSGVDFTEIDDPTTVQPSNQRPKRTKIIKLIKRRRRFTVKWKKVKGVKGYQIQYSTKKSFKKKYRKTVYVKKAKTVKKTVKKLKSGKKYYVRVRAYKVVDGKKIFAKWSAKKSVRVK